MIEVTNNKNLVLSSLEVAEMIEKTHANLMKDIRKYSGYLAEVKNDPNEVKIDLVEFWTESTYNDAKGESRPCYMVTKKGCEFIAHKTTGQKGAVFTARYINRFHEMEDFIRTGLMASQEVFIPMQSKTTLPRRSNWYQENKDTLKFICESLDISHRELYHKLLQKLGETYDLTAANEIYRRERGFSPQYAIDIIGYFPELEKESNKLLQSLTRLIRTK